jgi:hypothetical protein
MLRCVVLFVFGLPCLSFAVACCLICVCVGGLLARLGWCWTVRGYAWLGVLVQVGYLLLVAWWQVGGSSAIGGKQFGKCQSVRSNPEPGPMTLNGS